MSHKIHLDFLVLGAQKAGTTSLHDWLVQHKDVCLPTIKETHFFSHDDRLKKGGDWYLAQFQKNTQSKYLTGEIDPEYLHIEGAAENIKRLSNVNKFIVVLRHPLERAYSQYLMSVRRGCEDMTFELAIECEKKRLFQDENNFSLYHHSYISRSLYSKQIARYIAQFPDGKFLFINFDDLIDKDKGQGCYKGICEFIGTTQDLSLVNRSKSSNQASTPRIKWLMKITYLQGEKSLLRKVIGSILSDNFKLKLAMNVDRLNQKTLNKSKIKPLADQNIRHELISELLRDLEDSELITGLSLQNWKESLIRRLNSYDQPVESSS